MKPTNKDLKKLRDEIGELQSKMFKTLGGEDSYSFRVKLGDIANDIRRQMKQNEINGDDSVNYF